MKKFLVCLVAVVASGAAVGLVVAGQGRGSGPVIYVTSQELFYDSVVTADPIPNKGPFQKLEMGGPSSSGLQTEFGHGQPGYRGGRWWVDVDGSGTRNEGDHFFVCPLLGPGRETQ